MMLTYSSGEDPEVLALLVKNRSEIRALQKGPDQVVYLDRYEGRIWLIDREQFGVSLCVPWGVREALTGKLDAGAAPSCLWAVVYDSLSGKVNRVAFRPVEQPVHAEVLAAKLVGEICHGWFSEKQLVRLIENATNPWRPYGYMGSFQPPVTRWPTGSCMYLTPSGKRIEVTEITRGPTHTSLWDDMQYVGEVTDCIRDGDGIWLEIDGVKYGPE